MRGCVLLALVCCSMTGCAAAPASTAQAPARNTSSAPTAASTPLAAGSVNVREEPELRRELEAEGVTGTIALLDTSDGAVVTSDVSRAKTAVLPVSTFEIPNSSIALETGVIDGPETVMRWDGKPYDVVEWNHDMTFREALRVSCVPCFQEVARRVGDQRMREWVEKLSYGNADTSGGVDRFWLGGGMRISPLEQLDFLRRFDGNQLPVSSRTADIVRDIMTLDVTDSYVLRGKTGRLGPAGAARELGWFVGWLELGERRIFFATLLDGSAPGVDLQSARRRVTERVLHARGYL